MLVGGECWKIYDKNLDAISKCSGYICDRAAEFYMMIRMFADRTYEAMNNDTLLLM